MSGSSDTGVEIRFVYDKPNESGYKFTFDYSTP